MKKIILLALIAASMFAAKTTNKTDWPLPICDPCPEAR
jgi:hypothetical protein